MKKDRNCGAAMPTPYPMPMPNIGYPVQPPMMQGPMPMCQPPMMQGPMMQGPMMCPNMGMPNNDSMNNNQVSPTNEQLQIEINNLDRRVSRIESMMQDTKGSSFANNKYSDSNYHMM